MYEVIVEEFASKGCKIPNLAIDYKTHSESKYATVII